MINIADLPEKILGSHLYDLWVLFEELGVKVNVMTVNIPEKDIFWYELFSSKGGLYTFNRNGKSVMND